MLSAPGSLVPCRNPVLCSWSAVYGISLNCPISSKRVTRNTSMNRLMLFAQVMDSYKKSGQEPENGETDVLAEIWLATIDRVTVRIVPKTMLDKLTIIHIALKDL